MRLALLSLACVVASPLVAAQVLPAELAKLVPEEAVLVIAVRSPDELATALETVRVRAEPEGAALTGRALLAALALELDLPGDVAELDPTRPAALALRVGRRDGFPTFVLPTRDADKWIASTAGSPEKLSFAKGAGWVACTVGDAPPTSGKPSRLVENWPNTVVAGRVDAARLLAHFKLEIDAALGQFEQMIEAGVFEQAAGPVDMTEMLELYLEFAKDLVASADMLELVGDTGRGEYAVRGELRNKPSSPLAKYASSERVDWRGLAGRVDPTATMQLVGNYSTAALGELSANAYADAFDVLADSGGLPREFVAVLQALVEHSSAIQQVSGREIACGADFGGQGLRMTVSVRPPDASAYEQAWGALLGDAAFAALGLVTGAPQPTRIDGVAATTWKLAFDVERLLKFIASLRPEGLGDTSEATAVGQLVFQRLVGGEHLGITLARSDARVVVVASGSDSEGAWRESALKRALQGGEPSKELARIAAELEGANPAYGVCFDVARLLGGVAAAFEGTPLAEEDSDDVLAGLRTLGATPLPVVMQWSVRGATMGFVVRVGGPGLLAFVDGVRAIESAESKRRQARAKLLSFQWGLVRWAAHHDGAYPARLDELAVLDPYGEPYADSETTDPWGRPYVYELSTDKTTFVVRTLGSDGKPGGRGAAGDLSTDDLPAPKYVVPEELDETDDDEDPNDGDH